MSDYRNKFLIALSPNFCVAYDSERQACSRGYNYWQLNHVKRMRFNRDVSTASLISRRGATLPLEFIFH